MCTIYKQYDATTYDLLQILIILHRHMKHVNYAASRILHIYHSEIYRCQPKSNMQRISFVTHILTDRLIF